MTREKAAKPAPEAQELAAERPMTGSSFPATPGPAAPPAATPRTEAAAPANYARPTRKRVRG